MRHPLGYIDKLCVAGTRGPWASNAPTWRLVVRGRITEDALREATRKLLVRWPILASHLVALEGDLETGRHFAWDLDPAPDVARALTIVDLRTSTEAEQQAVDQRLVDRFLALDREYPFALTWVRLPPDGDTDRSVLHLQQHHGLADGRAFLLVAHDLVRLVDCAQRGVEPPEPEVPFGRRPELSVLPGGFARVRAFVRGFLWSAYAGLRNVLLPLKPLRCNLGDDYTGRNRTKFLVFPASRLDAWRRARERIGVSTNDLLTGALAVALARWSRRHGVEPGRARLFTIVDTRPRNGAFVSFANHLSSFLLALDLRGTPTVAAIARDLARQVAFQRRHDVPHSKLLIEAPVTQAVPISWLRRIVFEKPELVANHAFSNLLPLEIPGVGPDGRWHGADFVVEALRVTTPCTPPQGANTTVVRYGDEICFNFNSKDSAVDDALVADLSATFEAALAEVEA